MEYTGETYQCYDCNHTWAHEDDACSDCGSSYFTEINRIRQILRKAELNYLTLKNKVK